MINTDNHEYDLLSSVSRAEEGDLQGMYEFISYIYQEDIDVEMLNSVRYILSEED